MANPFKVMWLDWLGCTHKLFVKVNKHISNSRWGRTFLSLYAENFMYKVMSIPLVNNGMKVPGIIIT